MAANSNIEWTDHTFSPWIGCTKVGPGCDHCYAERDFDLRMHRVKWGAGNPRSRTAPGTWAAPLQWNRQHAKFYAEHGRRQRVFCASLADVFDNEVDPQWRRDLFDLIELTPNLTWMLLTKRIGNVFRMVADARTHDWLAGQRNVWLGITVVNQEEADRDIPKLLAVPATKRFLSVEPVLGPIEFRWQPYAHQATGEGYREYLERHGRVDQYEALSKIDWIICGGESGPHARPMNPAWAQSLRDQCVAAGVPYFFKQWGEWLGAKQDGNPDQEPWELNASDEPVRIGKKAAGRLLDGRTWDEIPA